MLRGSRMIVRVSGMFWLWLVVCCGGWCGLAHAEEPKSRETSRREAAGEGKVGGVAKRVSQNETSETTKVLWADWRGGVARWKAWEARGVAWRREDALRLVRVQLAEMDRSVVRMSPTQAAKVWSGLLRAKHPLLRRFGVEALGKMGEGGRLYRNEIVSLLNEDQPEVQEAALRALRALGVPRDVQGKIAGLRRSVWPKVREAAWWALGAVEGGAKLRSKELWGWWLEAGREGYAAAILAGFVRSGSRSRRIEREMWKALEGADEAAVRWACRYLSRGSVPFERVRVRLWGWFLSKEAKTRLEVLRVLRKDDKKEQVRRLFLRALEDKAEEVRRLAAEVLMEESWSAWEEVKARLERADKAIEEGVIAGIVAQGKEGWERVRSLLREEREIFLRTGLRALEVQGKAASGLCEAIHEKASERRWTVRLSAVRAIGKVCLEQTASQRWLAGLLGDSSEEVRFAAADALGDGVVSPLSLLQDAVSSRGWRTRQATARALGALGGEIGAVRPLLLKLLEDESWAVRRAVVDAVGRLGALMIAERGRLRRLLKDRDRDVKFAAMRALVALEEKEEAKQQMLLRWIEGRGGKTLRLEALRWWSVLGMRLQKRAQRGRLTGPIRRWLRGGALIERQVVLRSLRKMGAVGREVWPELVMLVRGRHRSLQLGALRAIGAVDDPPMSLVRSLLVWGTEEVSVRRRVAREVLREVCGRVVFSRSFWEPWLREKDLEKRRLVLRCLERGGWRALSSLEGIEPLLSDADWAIRRASWRIWRGFGSWGAVGLRRLWDSRPRGVERFGEDGRLWAEVFEGAGVHAPQLWYGLIDAVGRGRWERGVEMGALEVWFRAMLASKETVGQGYVWSCVRGGPWWLRGPCARRLGKLAETKSLLHAFALATGVERVLLRKALGQRSSGVLVMALRGLAEDSAQKDRWLGYLSDATLWQGEGGEVKDAKLVGALRGLLVSKDPIHRRFGARGYAYWQDVAAQDVVALVERLVEEDVVARRWVVAALLRLRVKGILALVEALRKPDWAGAEFAVALLLKMGEEAVPILREKLASGSPQERLYAVYALSEMGTAARAARREFLMALRDQQQEVQIAAAFALCRLRIQSVQAEGILRRYLVHAEEEKRLAAALALARIEPLSEETLRMLVARKKTDESAMKAPIMRALGRHLRLSQQEYGFFFEGLRETDAARRRYAARSFFLFVQALSRRCKTQNADCSASWQALMRPVFLEVWLRLLKNDTLPVQRSLLEALVYLPHYPMPVMRALLESLSHPEPEMRLVAVRIVGQAGMAGVGAMPLLLGILRSDTEAAVRKEAVVTLRRLYALFLVVPQALKEASSDMDTGVAQEAQKALRDIER
jgi:HEAT repeat protein